jgi:hypothetical protein
MVKELVPLISVEEARLSVVEAKLFDEFKIVHERYGNSEQPFAILELPSVQERFGGLSGGDLLEALRAPLDASSCEGQVSPEPE